MRILVIKLSSLGDLFHALPAVHLLKSQLNADIDWVTHSAYTELVNCFSDVERVIAFPRNSLRTNGRTFLTQLRQTEYDLIIDFQGLLKSACVARAARGKRRIGPSFHRECSHFFYQEVAGKRNKNRHAVIENMDIISHLQLQMQPPAFPIAFPPVQATPQSPHIVICPASRWQSKNWPAERFAAVAHQLQQDWHASISLVGAPADRAICQQIGQQIDSAAFRNLAGKTTIVEMGSIIQSADLLISNDSGPVHMAAAVATPTVVIFGPTRPERTGPFGEGHRVLQKGTGCNPPCMKRHCQHPARNCINAISVSDVVGAAEAALQQTIAWQMRARTDAISASASTSNSRKISRIGWIRSTNPTL